MPVVSVVAVMARRSVDAKLDREQRFNGPPTSPARHASGQRRLSIADRSAQLSLRLQLLANASQSVDSARNLVVGLLALNVAIVTTIIGLASNRLWTLNELLPPFFAGALGIFIMVLTRTGQSVEDTEWQRELLAASSPEEVAGGLEKVLTVYSQTIDTIRAAINVNLTLYYWAAAGEALYWLLVHVLMPLDPPPWFDGNRVLPTTLLIVNLTAQLVALTSLHAGVRQWSKRNAPKIEAGFEVASKWIEHLRGPVELVGLLPLIVAAGLMMVDALYGGGQIAKITVHYLFARAEMPVQLAWAMLIPLTYIVVAILLFALIEGIRRLSRRLQVSFLLLLLPSAFVVNLFVLMAVLLLSRSLTLTSR